jgi:hypothetical protein
MLVLSRRLHERILFLSLPEMPSWQAWSLFQRSFFRWTVGADLSALHPYGIIATRVAFLSNNLPAQQNAAR